MSMIATIGFFDGVHCGHRYLLSELRREARALALEPLIVTFRQHPREILHSDFVPRLLMTPDERLAMLLAQGIRQVRMLDFAAIQHWNKERFLTYLHNELDVTALLLGYDHRFGSDGNSDYENYQAAAVKTGVRLLRSTQHKEAGQHVSSTEIRRLLSEGDIEAANRLLGYPYRMEGHIISGKQIGRTIGFPTANIALPDIHKLIPKSGVYAVEVVLNGITHKGLLNIGTNPTVGGMEQTLEVHVLDFDGDLYGKPICVYLHRYLRPEQKFDSLEALKRQIVQDIAIANSL